MKNHTLYKVSITLGVIVTTFASYPMDLIRFKLAKIENRSDYTITLDSAKNAVFAELKPGQTQNLDQLIELNTVTQIWKQAFIPITAQTNLEEVKRALRIGHGIGGFSDGLHSFVVLEKSLSDLGKWFKVRGEVIAGWSKDSYSSLSPRQYLIIIIFAGDKLNESTVRVVKMFDKLNAKYDDYEGLEK